MPGLVLSIGAPTGSAVEAGDSVVTLEAMKMEHGVPSPRSGRVTDVVVQVGDQVERGQPLAIVEST
jgi:biotin carboxyl carrier protein